MSIHAIIVKSKFQLPCLRPINAFPKSIHASSWEGALLPLRKVEYNSSDNKKYIILKFEWKMGDKCGVFRENGTEFQSNNGEKDASKTFIESEKYAGEEWILQVLKQMMLQIVYQTDGAPIIRRLFSLSSFPLKEYVSSISKQWTAFQYWVQMGLT